MTLPKHSPEHPLYHDDSYEGNVRCYGKPPKGYRWLNVGDKTSSKTLIVTPWNFMDYPYGPTVKIDQWPAIEPIAKTPKAKPNTPLYNLNIKENPMPTHTPKTLKYKIVTRQNGLVAVQITEQSHRGKEFGEKGSDLFGDLASGMGPAKHSHFFVRGSQPTRDNDLMLLTEAEFEAFEKEVVAYNKHFAKPAVLRTVFFEYAAGSVHGYRRVEVIREDETYLEGIDSKKGSYRRFLKSKIVGPVDTVKA